jgi:PTH2 family peptidyl-tRNA hydrolase
MASIDSATSFSTAAAAPSKLVFYVTGFGRFRGVEVNPSSSIARRIVEEYRLNAPPRQAPYNLVEIRESRILEVSGGGVDEYVASLRTALTSSVDGDSAVYVLLHFGVAAGAPSFALEQSSYNTADFRVPDERGVQAAKAPIDPDEPLGTRHNTTLPVPALAERLADAGLPTVASQDPGRFICNWVFYRSCCLTEELNAAAAAAASRAHEAHRATSALRGGQAAAAHAHAHATLTPASDGDSAAAAAAADGVQAAGERAPGAAPRFHSLFCHVPSLETADMDVQLLLAVQLICAIAEALHEGTDAFMRRHRPQPQSRPHGLGLEDALAADEAPGAAMALGALLAGSVRGAGATSPAGAGAGGIGAWRPGLPPSAYGHVAGAGSSGSGGVRAAAATAAAADGDEVDDEALYGPRLQQRSGPACATDADFAARLAAAKSGDVFALLPASGSVRSVEPLAAADGASAAAVAFKPHTTLPPVDAAFEAALAAVAALGFDDALCRKALRATARSGSRSSGSSSSDAPSAPAAPTAAEAAVGGAAAAAPPPAIEYSVADAVDWIMAALESGEGAGLLQGEGGLHGGSSAAADALLPPSYAAAGSNPSTAARLPSFVVPGDAACTSGSGGAVRPEGHPMPATSAELSLPGDGAASQAGSTPAASPQLRLPFSIPSGSPSSPHSDRAGAAVASSGSTSSVRAEGGSQAQVTAPAPAVAAAPAADTTILQRGGSGFGDVSAARESAAPSVPAAAPLSFDLSSLLSAAAASAPPTASGAVAQTLAGLLAAAAGRSSATVPYKMVIVVRHDLGMSPGKVAAQCCHAALKAVTAALRASSAGPSTASAGSLASRYGSGAAAGSSALADRVAVWQSQGEPIVVLKCDGLDHLRMLQETARAVGLPTAAIRDAGRTEVEPGTTTVMAIGPAPKGEIDAVTGALRLL